MFFQRAFLTVYVVTICAQMWYVKFDPIMPLEFVQSVVPKLPVPECARFIDLSCEGPGCRPERNCVYPEPRMECIPLGPAAQFVKDVVDEVKTYAPTVHDAAIFVVVRFIEGLFMVHDIFMLALKCIDAVLIPPIMWIKSVTNALFEMFVIVPGVTMWATLLSVFYAAISVIWWGWDYAMCLIFSIFV